MLEAATVAFENLLVPTRLGYLFIGVLMGLALGAIPGLGGLVGLAILLPFTFDMDSFEAFAIMIGLISVTSTSGHHPLGPLRRPRHLGVPGHHPRRPSNGQEGRGRARLRRRLHGFAPGRGVRIADPGAFDPGASPDRARVRVSRVLHAGPAGHLHGGGPERQRAGEGARRGSHRPVRGHGGHGPPDRRAPLGIRPTVPVGRRPARSGGVGHLRHPRDRRPDHPGHAHRRRSQGAAEGGHDRDP